jgi:hypothetical protein
MSNEKNSEREKNNYSLNFFNKAMRKIRSKNRKETIFTLTNFPYEILLMICLYLSPKDLIICGIVCKTLNNVINDVVFAERLKLFKHWHKTPSYILLKCAIPNVGIDCELFQAYLHNISFKKIKASPRIGANFTEKSIPYNDKIIRTQFWDINYSEGFQEFAQGVMGSSNSTFIIIDMNHLNSEGRSLNLEQTQKWLDVIKKKITSSKLFIALIGHYDPEQILQISDEDLVLFSEKNNIHFCSTIDRTNKKNINNLFKTLVVKAAEHSMLQGSCVQPEKSKPACLVM